MGTIELGIQRGFNIQLFDILLILSYFPQYLCPRYQIKVKSATTNPFCSQKIFTTTKLLHIFHTSTFHYGLFICNANRVKLCSAKKNNPSHCSQRMSQRDVHDETHVTLQKHIFQKRPYVSVPFHSSITQAKVHIDFHFTFQKTSHGTDVHHQKVFRKSKQEKRRKKLNLYLKIKIHKM